MNPLYTIITALAVYLAIGISIAGAVFLGIQFSRSKYFRRMFSPCKECRFIPSAVAKQNSADGAWHQIQECERCGQKRDVVLSQGTLEAAQKFFFGQQL